ncbi:MAG: S-ribosylhomocysteine lyase [Clostridia bacterium]|nr:S-ribosylhomocysteine lyase [Clostridia bacterium]
MNRIASFSVDHDYIVPGIYLSRIDGDVVTYDLRTRVPNQPDLMSNATMHTFEHMFATFVRNSELSDHVIYFGPMGCQTGFYLLVRGISHNETIALIKDTLQKILAYEGEVFGKSRKECGNYINLELSLAKEEAARYFEAVKDCTDKTLSYPKGEEI